MKTRSIKTGAGGRRDFLRQMSGGMALGGLGVGLGASPVFGRALWSSDGEKLDFGKQQRLVDLLTATPLGSLQAALVAEMKNEVSLERLIAAGALANARAFGGQDYDGYHAFMALIPALQIARASSGALAPLAVLKVLYRNSTFIHAAGAHRRPALSTHVEPSSAGPLGEREADAQALSAFVAREDMHGAEAMLDQLIQRDPERAFEALIPVIWMEVDVHRVVLAWRAWDMQRLTGTDYARTLLRQSIRQCVGRERDDADNRRVRREMPAVLAESNLMGTTLGSRSLNDKELHRLANDINRSNQMQGAELVARSLASGVDPRSIGEAMSLACTYLMLKQRGRSSSAKGRPVGSVHGAGTGVHASDTAAAWRGMANFGSQKQCKLALVAGGYHTAHQGRFVSAEVIGYQAQAEKLNHKSAGPLLASMNAAISSQDQVSAAAAASAFASAGHDMQQLLDACRDHSVRAEGALHAEKYFRTQAEVIASDRKSLIPLHAAALARVCASQAGEQARGLDQAMELLG